MVRAIILLALFAGVSHAQVLKAGDPAVELDAATDASGKPVKLASYRGRWIVMTIGAAWCGPCHDELQHWDKVAADYAGRATFIALDIDEDIKDGKAFHTDLGLQRMVRIYMPVDRSRVVDRYGAANMPTTFVIGPDGVVRYVQPKFEKTRAAAEVAKLRAALDRLIPKPKPPPPPTSKDPPKEPVTPPPQAPTVTPIGKPAVPEPPHAMWSVDGWSLRL